MRHVCCTTSPASPLTPAQQGSVSAGVCVKQPHKPALAWKDRSLKSVACFQHSCKHPIGCCRRAYHDRCCIRHCCLACPVLCNTAMTMTAWPSGMGAVPLPRPRAPATKSSDPASELTKQSLGTITKSMSRGPDLAGKHLVKACKSSTG